MVFREQPGQSVFPWSSESVSMIMELNNFVSVIYFPNDYIHEPNGKFIPFISQFKSLRKLKQSVAFTKLL